MILKKRREHHLQMDIVRWAHAQYPNILMTIAPNIKKSLAQGVMLKRMGLLPGTPDLMIFEPRGHFHGMFLEIKMPGGYPSPEQKAFKVEAEQRRYWCAICPGTFKTEKQCFDWAIGVIKHYMELPTPQRREL